MTAGNRDGATAVVDRPTRARRSAHAALGPTTRDIPLPPRALRVGLTAESALVSTTDLPAITDDPRPAAVQPTASQPSAAAREARTVQERPVTTPPASGPQVDRDRPAGPPSALKARTALIAVAAGAAAAAVAGSGADTGRTAEPAGPAPALAASTAELDGGAVTAAGPADMSTYGAQLAVGKQLSDEAAAREAAARKPLFASPLAGDYSFTSGYAMRWGSFHGGLDLAAPLGTPIHAVTDGVVINAGPASGYGNWIQVKAADGTVTMYGHMAGSGVLVSKGQQVTAGDVIGLVGSEGFSTGPHLHFEVWKNGVSKIDPAPWLAHNGIRLHAYTG